MKFDLILIPGVVEIFDLSFLGGFECIPVVGSTAGASRYSELPLKCGPSVFMPLCSDPELAPSHKLDTDPPLKMVQNLATLETNQSVLIREGWPHFRGELVLNSFLKWPEYRGAHISRVQTRGVHWIREICL